MIAGVRVSIPERSEVDNDHDVGKGRQMVKRK
jgi:hypothetical protein